MVLDPPVSVPALEEAVHAVELIGPTLVQGQLGSSTANYLGPNFEVLASLGVRSFETIEAGTPQTFRRGDVEIDGVVQIGDAVALVEFLYRDGAEPPCVKAADANDSGSLSSTDAVAILQFIFTQREPAPGLFDGCVSDATADELGCFSYSACGGDE